MRREVETRPLTLAPHHISTEYSVQLPDIQKPGNLLSRGFIGLPVDMYASGEIN